MEKHQFKPFDQVLVRDSNLGLWRANLYSHLSSENSHVCTHGIWNYCIPYNEETKHLLGTTKAYTPPQPKTYHVEWGLDSQRCRSSGCGPHRPSGDHGGGPGPHSQSP